MRYQRGLSLGGLLIGAAIFGMLALLAMKVAPDWIEYGKVAKAVKATAEDGGLKEASVAQVREAYAKRVEIDNITAIPPSDLEITKENEQIVISFSYTRKVPLFYNVSLVFDFEGSSAGK